MAREDRLARRADRRERRQDRREDFKEAKQEFFGIDPEGSGKENFGEFLRRLDDDKLREMGYSDQQIRRIKLRRGAAKTVLTVAAVSAAIGVGLGIAALAGVGAPVAAAGGAGAAGVSAGTLAATGAQGIVAGGGAAAAGAGAAAGTTAAAGAGTAGTAAGTLGATAAAGGVAAGGVAAAGSSGAGQGDDRFGDLGLGQGDDRFGDSGTGAAAAGGTAAAGAGMGFGERLLNVGKNIFGKDGVVRSGSVRGRSLQGLELGEKLGRGARAAALYKPSQFEKDYQDMIKDRAKRLRAEQRQLAKARGGLTEGQRARLLADRNVIAAAANERMAQLARGGNVAVGQSGIQEQAKQELQRQNIDAQRKLVSDVRQADIDALERRIERFRQDEAMQEQRQLMALQLESGRRQRAVAELRPKQKSQPLQLFTNTPTGGSESREALETTIAT